MFHQSSSLHINLLAFKNMKKTMHVPFNMQKDMAGIHLENHISV